MKRVLPLLSRSGRFVAFVAAALILLAVLAAVAVAVGLRQEARERAEHEISRLAIVLAEQSSRMLQAVDVVLRDIDRDEGLSRLTTPAQLRAAVGTQAAHIDLLSRLSGLQQADAIMVVDADGRLVNSTRSWPPPPVPITDRPYFKAVRESADTAPVLSVPLHSRATGLPIVVLARRISAPDGSFLGLLGVPLRLRYLQDSFAALDLPAGMAVTVLRSDGTVLTDAPGVRQLQTHVMPKSSAWYSAVAAGGGDYWSPGWLDGEPRRVSAHLVTGFPVVIDVSITRSAIYRNWRRQVAAIAVGTLCVSACLLVLLRALLAQFHGVERAQAALLKKSVLLETTLANMDQGLIMITAERTLGVVNQRALELLDLPADVVHEGAPLDDILRTQRTRGEFSGQDAAERDMLCPGMLPDRAYTYERRRRNGTVLEIRSVPLPGGGLVQTHTDITLRTLAEERIRHAARHDVLTSLPNRVVLAERLAAALSGAHEAGTGVAVMVLDLDRFKRVNDTLGHAAGDELLRLAADRMRSVVRDSDTLARMGGDEFALVVPEIRDVDLVIAIAERLRDTIREPYSLAHSVASIGVSIGVACYPAHGSDAEQLLNHADLALYRAKATGRNACCVFNDGLDTHQHDELVLENALPFALQAEQFALVYQPIWDIRVRQIVGAEALVRWHHPVNGLISPSRFIPLAERTGLIIELGRWVMETACREAVSWARPITVSVNVAPAQLRRPEFVDELRDLLVATGLAPSRLKLEVTETQLLDETAEMLARMTALRDLGVQLSLDDFGTGHSSLSTLRSFPFSDVKIDRGFTQGIVQDPRSRGLIESIFQVCRVLNLECVAEGVETQEQLMLLQVLGCTHAQGYLIGYPEPPATIRHALWNVAADHRQELRKSIIDAPPAAVDA